MKRFLFSVAACVLIVAACACNKNKTKPDGPDVPDVPVFSLDSYNGSFVQALSDAYDTFEETGKLPVSVNVEGLTYSKGRYIIAACLLLDKMEKEPDSWQNDEIDPFTVGFSDGEYRWNTFDPDVIDMQHVRFLASKALAYAEKAGSLPNYVTFPSDDTTSPGYMPQLTMVVTKHDNLMNFRAYSVVLTLQLSGCDKQLSH